LINDMTAKTVQLLHELVPKGKVIGHLVNPNDPNFESDTQQARKAAATLGLRLVTVKASTESEIESAFPSFVSQHVAALFVEPDPFFTGQRAKIVALAARHALPAVYQLREFAAAGGLMSYGTSIIDANRQVGVYTGKVLKGTKPADLPVIQPRKFEFIINRKAARGLGILIPQALTMMVDEEIE
jgi:putative ABC transport system substrate-binding protein